MRAHARAAARAHTLRACRLTDLQSANVQRIGGHEYPPQPAAQPITRPEQSTAHTMDRDSRPAQLQCGSVPPHHPLPHPTPTPRTHKGCTAHLQGVRPSLSAVADQEFTCVRRGRREGERGRGNGVNQPVPGRICRPFPRSMPHAFAACRVMTSAPRAYRSLRVHCRGRREGERASGARRRCSSAVAESRGLKTGADSGRAACAAHPAFHRCFTATRTPTFSPDPQRLPASQSTLPRSSKAARVPCFRGARLLRRTAHGTSESSRNDYRG